MGDLIWSGGGIRDWEREHRIRAIFDINVNILCGAQMERVLTPNMQDRIPAALTFPVKQKDKFHLTGKPTPLMEELVQIVQEEAIILDPFAGSGTTCVVAKKHNRQYIGFEKTKMYYDIAERRITDV
jgi:DNA modification methylase